MTIGKAFDLHQCDIDKFNLNVGKQSKGGCVEWEGGTGWKGYGRMHLSIKHTLPRRTVKAHRFSWELHRGKIPEGMIICHKCDNPPCVNPDHLFIGTYQDNIDDQIRKGRLGRGETSNRATITEDQAVEAIRLYAKYGKSYGVLVRIAREVGGGYNAVSQVIRGSSWQHLDRPIEFLPPPEGS